MAGSPFSIRPDLSYAGKFFYLFHLCRVRADRLFVCRIDIQAYGSSKAELRAIDAQDTKKAAAENADARKNNKPKSIWATWL
jgi:hypothetical protein